MSLPAPLVLALDLGYPKRSGYTSERTGCLLTAVSYIPRHYFFFVWLVCRPASWVYRRRRMALDRGPNYPVDHASFLCIAPSRRLVDAVGVPTAYEPTSASLDGRVASLPDSTRVLKGCCQQPDTGKRARQPRWIWPCPQFLCYLPTYQPTRPSARTPPDAYAA